MMSQEAIMSNLQGGKMLMGPSMKAIAGGGSGPKAITSGGGMSGALVA